MVKNGSKSRHKDLMVYYAETLDKIKELKKVLKNKQTDGPTKVRVRNQISAYQTRLKNRIHPLMSEMQIKKIDDQINAVIKITKEIVTPSQMDRIMADYMKRQKRVDF